MPFGLRNEPETFQRTVEVILSSVKYKFAFVYLGDIVFIAKSSK